MYHKQRLNLALLGLSLAFIGCGKPPHPPTTSTPLPIEVSATPTALAKSEVIQGEWKLIGFGAPW